VFVRRKDAERQEARRLRAEGASVKRIAKRLGVAQSSVSVWVRDVETPPARSPVHPTMAGANDPNVPRRHCPRCVRDLPETCFNRNGEGRQHWCRECFREYFRARGDLHRKQSGAARERRQKRARTWSKRICCHIRVPTAARTS